MTEFVTVQVPVQRVQEVYELLGRQQARLSLGYEITAEGHPSGWSLTLVERMFVESSSAMRRILFAIAEAAPQWVTTAEIAAASGLGSRQVVASFGPFEKRVRGRYGMALWPFETRTFGDSGLLKYSMSRATATRVIDLMAKDQKHEKEAR